MEEFPLLPTGGPRAGGQPPGGGGASVPTNPLPQPHPGLRQRLPSVLGLTINRPACHETTDNGLFVSVAWGGLCRALAQSSKLHD